MIRVHGPGIAALPPAFLGFVRRSADGVDVDVMVPRPTARRRRNERDTDNKRRPREAEEVRAPSGKILGPLVRPEIVSKHVPQRVKLLIGIRIGPPERALVARDFAI